MTVSIAPSRLAASAGADSTRPSLAPRAAYVHVPFCKHHCSYCDFAVVAGQDERALAYVDSLARELATLEQPRPVDTIFIGGGTPTYLHTSQLARLLQLVRRWLPLTPGGEWSVESTPDSLSEETVGILVDAGVNRVSIGAQSFRDRWLIALDRRHAAEDIAPAFERVRRRVDNVSLDLIFGIPGETLADWQADLATAIALCPKHISCYGLTYEKGTPLWKEREAGRVCPVAESAERDMFLAADEMLGATGYDHYEISNYAQLGYRCRHNETYWANDGYFGFGLGAARYVAGRREANTRSLGEYIGRLMAGRNPTHQSEVLDRVDRARETMSVQLRRRSGIDRQDFAIRTGIEFDDLFGDEVQRLVGLGMMSDSGAAAALTREGLCVADSVLERLWRASILRDGERRGKSPTWNDGASTSG